MGATEIPSQIFRFIESDIFRQKTQMWLGKRKLSSLYFYLQGAFHTIQLYNLDSKIEVEAFRAFHEWVEKYYNLSPTSKGWCTLILEHKEFNEEEALDEFFKLYDLFKPRT